MRGTVLLLGGGGSLAVDVDLLREDGLLVFQCHDPSQVLSQFHQVAPDVVVVALSADDSPSVVPGLRALADRATSIIVASASDRRDSARAAGADSFLLNSATPSDLLYEIHRALILRRSGRRVPWNW